MRLIFLLLGLATSCGAHSCDKSYNGFLGALKNEINSDDGKSRALEVEFGEDFHKLVRQCFATSTDDSSKCALSDEEFNTDICGDGGPLRGCDKCQKLCLSIKEKILRAPENQRKCFRRHFAEAVRQEMEPCIQGKLNDYEFHIETLPDFDERTYKSIDIVEKCIYQRTMAYSRMDVCRKVNPNKYQSTSQCMARGYAGIYSKHCQCSKNAKANSISSSCSARFSQVKAATVSCLYEKRKDWHDKFNKVYQIVRDADSASECGNEISKVLGNWLTMFQNALSSCIPNDQEHQKQRDLRTLIQLGCGQVINGGSASKNELTVGFRLLRLFLDALNDRILVYVDNNCNY